MSERRTVVSANYLDRISRKARWLVRKKTDSVKKAVRARSVYATGVVFGDSTEIENGFGCGTVAYCETATYDQQAPADLDMRRLRFGGYYFHDRETGKRITSCDHLILTEDGQMFMAANSPTQKPAADPVVA